jgi:hypothetical protein
MFISDIFFYEPYLRKIIQFNLAMVILDQYGPERNLLTTFSIDPQSRISSTFISKF